MRNATFLFFSLAVGVVGPFCNGVICNLLELFSVSLACHRPKPWCLRPVAERALLRRVHVLCGARARPCPIAPACQYSHHTASIWSWGPVPGMLAACCARQLLKWRTNSRSGLKLRYAHIVLEFKDGSSHKYLRAPASRAKLLVVVRALEVQSDVNLSKLKSSSRVFSPPQVLYLAERVASIPVGTPMPQEKSYLITPHACGVF
jgi:hypothetical protein